MVKGGLYAERVARCIAIWPSRSFRNTLHTIDWIVSSHSVIFIGRQVRECFAHPDDWSCTTPSNLHAQTHVRTPGSNVYPCIRNRATQ